MTAHPIIPKIAYIPLEYTIPVDEFVEFWGKIKVAPNKFLEPPTQKDYDDWCLSRAEDYFCIMLSDNNDGSIRLKEDNWKTGTRGVPKTP